MDFDLRPVSMPVSDAERNALLTNPGFGKVFTEHMVTVQYHDDKGWYDAQLVPYGPLSLDPATATLHYAQSIFEGLKAYQHSDGSVRLFRPDRNAARFNSSARRLAMPELPEEVFLESLRILVEQDRAWIPTAPETSLYLRPLMFATESFLGVRPSKTFTYLLIASPVGAYFADGVKPVTVWLSTEYTRAAPGGTGAAKTAGNYAASLAAQMDSLKRGCDQVVWLDAIEHRWVEEMGGMNLFFVFTDENGQHSLVTPELTGTLLPGITRESLIELASDLGYPVTERRISTDEWRDGVGAGTLTEVFACGTAAVITPVGTVRSAEGEFVIGDGSPGPVTMQLRETLLAIQSGERPDHYGWVHTLLSA
ncbi:MAG: branched-chain amino acid aminotransferase [Corynebacteriales bacterium]|nr:branched-chain amino acid aminotransferase [Mycobacteriales bacterium]